MSSATSFSCRNERKDILHLRNRIDRFRSNASVEMKERNEKKDTATRPFGWDRGVTSVVSAAIVAVKMLEGFPLTSQEDNQRSSGFAFLLNAALYATLVQPRKAQE